MELVRIEAEQNYQNAFSRLQFASDDEQQFIYCHRMEVWQSVLVLIDQRDKLEKYCRLLIGDDSPDTIQAAVEYLRDELGVNI